MGGKFVRYSKQKFSSNVVEKCLRQSEDDSPDNKSHQPEGEKKNWRRVIVTELCLKAGELISDKYGNYCLQTALQQSAAHDKQLLADFTEAVTPHLDSLRENVKAKWIKLLESAQSSQNTKPSKTRGGKQKGRPRNRRNNNNQHNDFSRNRSHGRSRN